MRRSTSNSVPACSTAFSHSSLASSTTVSATRRPRPAGVARARPGSMRRARPGDRASGASRSPPLRLHGHACSLHRRRRSPGARPCPRRADPACPDGGPARGSSAPRPRPGSTRWPSRHDPEEDAVMTTTRRPRPSPSARGRPRRRPGGDALAAELAARAARRCASGGSTCGWPRRRGRGGRGRRRVQRAGRAAGTAQPRPAADQPGRRPRGPDARAADRGVLRRRVGRRASTPSTR